MPTRYTLVAFVALVAIGLFVYIYRTPAQPAPAGQLEAAFGSVSLSLELATSTAALELGLGGRASLAADHAMLFVFPDDERWGFWMKDTLIPLDMFWLDDQGHVLWMEQNVATSTYPNVFYPPVPAHYVLETNAGFAALNAIATGTPLSLQNLQEISK